ncbi:MAG: hypothetical protein GF393_10980 [Armatimonadia bacterium]|nr:hypothetical protein [Armatimonadia bacterium]
MRRALAVALGLVVLTGVAPAQEDHQAPNVDVETFVRIWPTTHTIQLRAWLYNTKKATFEAYRVDLHDIAPDASAIYERDEDEPDSVPYRIKHLDLSGRRASARWTMTVEKLREDSWMDRDIEAPKLSPGVYVVSMKGGGVEKRTWFAVSDRAMLAKRSPDVVFGWLVNAQSGQPVEGSWVHLYDEDGRVDAKQTERDGTVSFDVTDLRGRYWMTATGGDPTFVTPSAPGTVPAYKAYVYTDRPIYRPGHLVQFRGTVRAAERGTWEMPDGIDSVTVEIKFAGDPVYREELDLNEWGTFAGEFQLAPEPSLGEYDLVTTIGSGEERTVVYKEFSVQAYRKPEFEPMVTIPKDYYLQGETIPVTISADYFFGSPVSGGKVEYEVSFSRQGSPVPDRIRDAAGLGAPGAMEIESDFSGTAILDDEGKFVLEVPTSYATVDRRMYVSATVKELALRPREASASTLITAAQFRLSVDATQYRYIIDEETPTINVRTADYEGNGISQRVEVAVIEPMKDREGRYYEERTEYDVETDSEGRATVTFEPKRPNRYQVEAWAMDDENNPVYDDDYFYVEEREEDEREWPTLTMSADESRYEPGEVAKIHTQTDQLGAWMLLTIEGERLFEHEVYRLQGNEFDLKIPIEEAYKPGVEVNAAVVREGERTQEWVNLNVPHDDRKLEVIVTPDQEEYEPAAAARYAIVTRDWRDRGVPAEVGLSVVDEALYEIMEDHTPSPFAIFWGERRTRVTTDFSHAHMYPGGGAQMGGTPPPTAAAPARREEMEMAEMPVDEAITATDDGIRIRRRFEDTALWRPSVVTSPDGRASVEFEMPDNLTTWRAIARAVDRETRAGEGRETATVTMPLLVRLVLPRFYVEGDEGTAAAIVHNYTGEGKTVNAALSADGAQVHGEPRQQVSIPAEGIVRLTWRITATDPGEARFVVSADGGEGAQDAMQTLLPIVPSGVENVDAWAGSSDGNVSQTVTLPEDALEGSAELVVTLSPSLAGPIFEALDYLVRYPYGCAEQTMDSFLPSVIVARTLERLDADRPEPEMLDRYVNFGLQKLIRYQHDDGGWHWWEFDDSDPYISAYIVYGLKVADEAGYVAAEAPMRRGVSYLIDQLDEERYARARAYLLWALAYADVWNNSSWEKAADALEATFSEREKLDAFSLASLGLALHRISESDVPEDARAGLRGMALQIADQLEARAIREGIGVHWAPEGRATYSWLNNDVEVTSQVMRLMMAVKPGVDTVDGAVRWLMAMREGKQWRSTKDTASAVIALAEYLETTDELEPNYTANVSLGGEQVGRAQFSAEDVFADPQTMTVDAAKLAAGDNALAIDKDGAGTVYWSARMHYLLPAEDAVPTTDDIVVKREYTLPAENPVDAGTQDPGDVVHVTLRLKANEDLHYAMLEEPIPAGCEVISGEERPWDNPWDRREVWDRRIIFFFNYLSEGVHEVSYVMRAEAPGEYRILPSTASLMYFPEVRGYNQLVRMRVADVAEVE